MALLCLPSLAAVHYALLRPGVVALDVLLLLAVVVDLLRTPSPAALDVRRGAPESAGLSQDFVRRARIDPGPAGGLRCELREEFSDQLVVRAQSLLDPGTARRTTSEPYGGPAGLFLPPANDPTGGPDVVRLPASGPVDVLRVYRGGRRGHEWLGDLRLRIEGPLGLVQRQARLRGRLEVAIEPALLGLRETLRLAASERWHDLGVRRLRRAGGLMEFEALRDYVPGDDVRLVDWKAFARRGRPTVRQYQEERGQELILAVDCGRRMAAPSPFDVGAEGETATWTKLDHALDAVLQLAAVALSRGDRVGIAAFDARLLSYVAPSRGPLQLERLREAVFDRLPGELESDLAGVLRELGVRHPRRAMLLVVSDVADPLSVEAQRLALGAAGRQHSVVFAGLDDPEVREAAAAGGGDPGLRAAALELVREREVGLRELRRAGVRVLDALPAESAAPLLAAWLEMRRSG